MHLPLDPDAAYRAVAGRDERWDGRFYLGVTSTGIYCRPSCPARTPQLANCQFFPTAAAAVAAGFRACRRCRPDALPGSRGWDARSDLVARAVRLIADGVLDEHGVEGLAARLAVSARHLHRLLVSEVGASPQQLGRTRRAHTARTLIEQTTMSLSDVALAAGFGSVRQFNDVMRAEFGQPPSAMRRPVRGSSALLSDADGRHSADAPVVHLKLAYRGPIDLPALRRTLTVHAIAGVEAITASGDHLRVVDAPRGPALVRVSLIGQHAIPVTLRLSELSDLMPVVTAVRRWLDLDADPHQINAHLGEDHVLAPLVATRPGLRVPGAIDGAELGVCAIVGQQVSVSAAVTFQGRIAQTLGTPVADGWGRLGDGVNDAMPGPVVFPSASELAAAGPEAIRDAANLTRARARTVHTLATAIADGRLALSPGTDLAETRARLLALPGIGPWTADYVTLRALHDPDTFAPGDLVARKALATLGGIPLAQMTAARAEQLSRAWSPWRAYALQHLWTQEVYA